MATKHDFAEVQDFLHRYKTVFTETETESWDTIRLRQLLQSAFEFYPPWIASEHVQAALFVVRFLFMGCFLVMAFLLDRMHPMALDVAYLSVVLLFIWFGTLLGLAAEIFRHRSNSPVAVFMRLAEPEYPDGIPHIDLALDLARRFPTVKIEITKRNDGVQEVYIIDTQWVIKIY